MDITTVTRIEEALEYFSKTTGHKTTWSKLTQMVGKSIGASHNWKKGKIANNTLKDIANVLNVNFIWLLTGEGDMVDKQTTFKTDKISTPDNNENVQLEHLGQELIDLTNHANSIIYMEEKLKEMKRKSQTPDDVYHHELLIIKMKLELADKYIQINKKLYNLTI